jgi:hypothetical protein
LVSFDLIGFGFELLSRVKAGFPNNRITRFLGKFPIPARKFAEL